MRTRLISRVPRRVLGAMQTDIAPAGQPVRDIYLLPGGGMVLIEGLPDGAIRVTVPDDIEVVEGSEGGVFSVAFVHRAPEGE